MLSPMLATHRPTQAISQPITTEDMLEAFADFLNIDVGAGDAAPDTVATYSSHLQQFVSWCDRTGINPAVSTREDIKRYRRWMIEERR